MSGNNNSTIFRQAFLGNLWILTRHDYRREGPMEAIAFAPSILSNISTSRNISVYEDLNAIQMGIEKTSSRWNDWLKIWWRDLKTEDQMLSMHSIGIGTDRPYNRYQHIFLSFNYLTMVCELFHPDGSSIERSTLPGAADCWHRDETARPLISTR